MALHTVTGTLIPVQPFNIDHSLRFLGVFAPTQDEQHIQPHERTLTKATLIDGETVAFRITAPESSPSEVAYTLYAEAPISPDLEAVLRDRITFYLSLDDDLKPFYALADDDPPFTPIVQKLYGYHQVKFSPTPFENACWAILTARNRIPIARRMKDELVERLGGSIEIDGQRYTAFPPPEALLAAPDVLSEVAGMMRRAEYLRAVAEAFAEVDDAWLRGAPYGEVERWLRSIKGIGAWGASFVLIRGLGRTESVSVPEKNLLEAASRVYGRQMSEADVVAAAQHYGRYAGYWAHYLRIAG
jgi:DNA-3-methyladenine glycosylase II